MEQQLSNARTRIIELTGELQASRTEAKRTAEEAADLRQELQDAQGTQQALEGECTACSCTLHLPLRQELQNAQGMLQAEGEHSAYSSVVCLPWRKSVVCRVAGGLGDPSGTVHLASTMPCSKELCSACLVCHPTCLDCRLVWQLLRPYERLQPGG